MSIGTTYVKITFSVFMRSIIIKCCAFCHMLQQIREDIYLQYSEFLVNFIIIFHHDCQENKSLIIKF